MSLEIAPGWVCLFLSETCLSLAFDGRTPSMDEERAENHEMEINAGDFFSTFYDRPHLNISSRKHDKSNRTKINKFFN